MADRRATVANPFADIIQTAQKAPRPEPLRPANAARKAVKKATKTPVRSPIRRRDDKDADQLRKDSWTPHGRLVGIVTPTRRFAFGMLLPLAVRGRLAIVLRPCGGHVPRMDMVCGS